MRRYAEAHHERAVDDLAADSAAPGVEDAADERQAEARPPVLFRNAGRRVAPLGKEGLGLAVEEDARGPDLDLQHVLVVRDHPGDLAATPGGLDDVTTH